MSDSFVINAVSTPDEFTVEVNSTPDVFIVNVQEAEDGETGATGPAPSGTGLVSVTSGVLDSPSTLSQRVSSDAENLKTALGLGSVDNTADSAKPVSTIQQSALNLKAGICSVTEYLAGSSGTITPPADAKMVSATVIGGGGGGGSGRRGLTNNIRCGGGGGSAGGVIFLLPVPVSNITWPLAYSVGAGGTGGPAITTTNNGSPGQIGGNTTFGALTGKGGNFGSGGTASTGTGGAQMSGFLGIGTAQGSLGSAGGGTANASGGSGGNGAASTGILPSGGGAGGGISSGNLPSSGGVGGSPGGSIYYQLAGGLSASNGNTDPFTKIGTGGGGGNADGVLTGGRGADHGGGGGGGAASLSPTNSGAGGAGGNGLLVVTFYF